MNVYFDLALTQDCVLQIQDTTQQFPDTYLAEDAKDYITPRVFKYTDTYTVNVIKYVPSNGDTTILEVIITPHVDEETIMYCDEACYTLPKDGHYIIEHLIIPSKDCVDSVVNPEHYKTIFATDGTNFLKKESSDWVTCDIEEILKEAENSTTVSMASQDTFSICLLNKRYLELCKQHLCKLMSNHCLSSQQAHDLELDLIWMSMNAIKYNIEFGMLTQAQALLEEILKCTGITKLRGSNLNDKKNYGCNCCV